MQDLSRRINQADVNPNHPFRGELNCIGEQVYDNLSQLSLIWGQKTDLSITNELANANWGVGKKKVEYSAVLRLDAATQKVYFWEMIKESGRGLAALFSFKTETYRTNGTTRSGTVNETAYGPGGKLIDYNWDYSQVRQIIEAAVRSQGWQFETVLLKNKAMY